MTASLLRYARDSAWRAVEGKDSEGNLLNESELEKLCHEFESGYSQNPTYCLHGAIETVLSHDETSITARLKTGETVKLEVCHYAEMCA